ncbi:Holliday junction branch migration protein RuvA [Paenibacillaceae bacterium WGS1546]|uniref:Holliday junction branch migration protein RuvA n=1 Tax=Cohnella sp. WGS1546 TaxID=3366810 RepID=UPI00372D83AA
MIDYLKGRIVHAEGDFVVIDVRDVGYQVFTPNPYAFARSESAVQLFTYYHVREDAVQLFGFETREEQSMFRRLLDVSGIGPKVALGALAGGRPETIAAAIQQENVAFLTKLPGIGKKTAQRMILDLKDKLGPIGLGRSAGAAAELEVAAVRSGNSAWEEAKEALAGLGYREAELDKAWLAMQERTTGRESADALIKIALQQLFQG